MQHGLIPTPGIMKSIVASRVTLPPQEEAQVANVQALPYPSTAPANVAATHITFDVWEWNAMFSLIYANGGPDTTKGSLMEKNGVNLTLHREDSNTQMRPTCWPAPSSSTMARRPARRAPRRSS